MANTFPINLEDNCYGDGCVFEKIRSKDSETKTIKINLTQKELNYGE